jgi:hypothetical protein
MRRRITPHRKHPSQQQPSWRTRIICAVTLLMMAAGAHAATVYRCTDHAGHVAYQDNPCAALTRQHAIDLSPQPLIGDMPARAHDATAQPHHRASTRSRPHRARIRHTKPATAWECRAANGEVFYRFTRCPGSVPGDGVVRNDYAQPDSNQRVLSRHNAWSRVRVHGVKVTRTEACHRIHSVVESSRDGYLRDAKVSTYDHLMGRDPCTGG